VVSFRAFFFLTMKVLGGVWVTGIVAGGWGSFLSYRELSILILALLLLNFNDAGALPLRSLDQVAHRFSFLLTGASISFEESFLPLFKLILR
jgi:hypothetical protein